MTTTRRTTTVQTLRPTARAARHGQSVAAYILAGGQSSRFGSDKARALVRGRPLILHVAAAVTPLVPPLTVIGRRPGLYEDLGLPTITDRHPERGPLGGLETALGHRPAPGWVLLVACDWLNVQSAWLEVLLEGRQSERLAVAFRDEWWEPLLALYHTDLLPQVQERVATGNGAVWRLLEAAQAQALAVPPGWETARQVNSPQDLDHLAGC